MKNILIVIITISVTAVSAQDKIRTLNDCMKYAVENAARRNKQEARNNIGKYNYNEAVMRLLPSVGVRTSAYFNFGRGLDPETNTYVNVNSFSNNYDIYTQFTLFSGFSLINKIRIEKMNVNSGKSRLKSEEDAIAYEVAEAYYNVLYFKGLLKYAEEQSTESENNLKRAERMEELGLKGYPDVAEFRAKYASDAYLAIKQNNILKIGIIILKEKMNYPLDETLEIADVDDSSTGMITEPVDDLISVYRSALGFNPKAIAAELSYKADVLNYKAEKGRLLPTLKGEAGVGTNFSRIMNSDPYKPFSEQFSGKRGSYVGFVLSVPIFNNFSTNYEIKRKKQMMKISENEMTETLRALYSDIEQAVTDMQGQAEQYKQAVEQINAMKTAHSVNKLKYDEGLTSALELTASANRLLNAQNEELGARLQYLLKSRLVRYFKGESFIENNN